MTTLLLVRHGQSEANRYDLFAGFYDAELEPHGEVQARMTADFLLENYQVDGVYASDLKRAYKTGQIIADRLGVPIYAEQGLREISGGAWEGVKFWELATLYPDDFAVWQTDMRKARCTGGESVQELADRVMSTIEHIAVSNPGKTLVIATHATPVRVAMTMVQHGSLDQLQNVSWVSNASVTTLTYDNGIWNCVSAGEDRHLEGMITELSKKV